LDEQYKDQALEILSKHHDCYVIGQVVEDDQNVVVIEKEDEIIKL
jgi:hydrogenase maturation factor